MSQLSEWLTVEEAAARLGTSTRSIERRIERGEIEAKKRPRAGKKPETVCYPRDVEKLMPRAHVVLGHITPAAVATRPAPNGSAGAWEAALEKIATILSAKNDNGAIGAIGMKSEKLWLDLKEAAAYSGLARSDLKRLCRNGTLTARKSPGWKILRKSLEEFEG